MTSLHETLLSIQSGITSCEDITSDTLQRIREGRHLNAFIEVYEADCIERARQFDNLKMDTYLPLKGIPVAVKDNICVKGKPVTCGSRILKNYISPWSATVIERLEDAGAVIIGRTNMDEFAMGSSNETSCYGPVLNPVDTSRVPGGSSGGSAAAVAAGMVPAAIGSDTGGSVRQPAAFCGVVGLKPTYGLVSRSGLVAFASSFDQIGPIATTVCNVARVLSVIAGHDDKDATTAPVKVPDYPEFLTGERPDLKICVLSSYKSEGVAPEISNAIDTAINLLSHDGFLVGKVDLANMETAVSAYYLLANAEASSNLARFDGVRYGFRESSAEKLEDMYSSSRGSGFGEEVKRRILLGTYALSAGYYDQYYAKAQKIRSLVSGNFQRIFNEYDLILAPVTPTLPFKLGENIGNPLHMYLGDLFTVPANLAGLPALSIPCGKTSAGLPVGLQVIADKFCETNLLRFGHYFEQLSSG